MKDVKETYTAFHERKNPPYVYPTEWVVRTFLGEYPTLSLDKTQYAGSKILDIAFGDGRNFPLLHNLSFELFGVEISDRIVSLTKERMNRMGIPAVLKTGTNSAIPFEDDFFEYVLACSSCYYVDRGTSFRDNLKEYSRVLKPGGVLVASLPHPDSFIFKDCIELEDGHVEIAGDSIGIRNGYIFRLFHSEEEILQTFGSYFESFSFGLCMDNFYGHQVCFLPMVCRKKL